MGNLRLALFLAYKSIIKGSRWTLIMIILVTSLSFSNLILTPSIMSGVTAAINQEQIDTLFGNIVIDPPSNKYYLADTSKIISQVAQTPGVAGTAPHLNSTAIFEYDWLQTSSPQDKVQSGNWNVIGIDPQKETGVTTIHENLIEGSYLSPGDKDQILLGVEIAGGRQADSKDFLTLGGVEVGGQVRLTFPEGSSQIFTVKGIFKARQEQANRMAFITTGDMFAALGQNIPADSASQILVRLQPGADEAQILTQLKSGGIEGQVRSWLDYGSGIGGIVSSFNVIASLIGGIGLIVAGVVMFIVII